LSNMKLTLREQEDAAKATFRGPRGKMTNPLVTKYDIGDSVTMVADMRAEQGDNCVPVGAVGVIRRNVISDPNAGDEALIFVVRFHSPRRMTDFVGEPQIVPSQDAEPALWLQRQLATLDPKEDKRNG